MVSLHTTAILAALAAVWLLVVGFRILPRWRLRHIPLVKPLPFLLGHLLVFVRQPLHECYKRWAREYGSIFLVFFGKNPCVVLTDPDLIRQVAVKHFAKFHDRPSILSAIGSASSKNKRLTALRSGLLVSRGGLWGSLRAAMNPLFHTTALHSYSPIMNDSVGRLLERLEGAAGSGTVPLDIHMLLGRTTLEVIGRTAFGVEFITDGEREDRQAGRPNLVAAVKVIFSAGGFMPGQGIGILFRIMPDWLEPALFWLFFTMVAAKRAALARGDQVVLVESDWRWWSLSSVFVQQNPYKNVTPAPNSVIDMLMRATNKETGQGLKDVQVAVQCNTLIAAGYETSANALAFTIYCLATHPETEARLLDEIDAFGGKEPGLDDLPHFPFVEAVINESLRLYPPAHTTNRECTAPGGCTLLGAGALRHLCAAPQPERFLDAEEASKRHPNAFMPFGLGPRMCIGYRFALQELQIVLIRIYQRFTFRLAAEQVQPLPLRAGLTLSPKDGLWVTAHQRADGGTAASGTTPRPSVPMAATAAA
ncbi:hypothetical protein CHLNCDRAFT_57715 [Chlorella variabilis]|uniref:Cytochrome P450 n=1 Tax=Chlorella variabilis TaxID=554065 RepID=E1ZE29_CHLVA|nr:hypothetical protein CHLNCDRAFT_57715 [Chlorella variabilis]EFN55959.1 hypothetical protein CHLNCDRAFT_57715 [Chlorella variabilis]|eukprot:XP_005848061.1 hypothetical protein CHLNCDRAFT_57715 [Chlorella variabilis]